MAILMRAPRECGSWLWELGETDGGLTAALGAVARVVDVLRRHSLLDPHALEHGWYIPGRGGLGLSTRLGLTTALDDPGLVDQVFRARPSGFPTAEISGVRVLGSGVWFDVQGRPHREPGLVDVEVTPDAIDLAIEVTVHHDIWKYFDFSGRPHPDVQRRNAPRLALALQDIEKTLAVKAVPGEPTYFGVAEGYGIATPDASDDGYGPDLTDKL
ncbi:hypothetical protein [Streptomyces specialis]|uniref:hypothetical protein n=1 Tax=Streptomyces specialis TaxID=498367 RepID=UPI000A60DD36|nr:hypothetical protein [Streptomyces specialis]